MTQPDEIAFEDLDADEQAIFGQITSAGGSLAKAAMTDGIWRILFWLPDGSTTEVSGSSRQGVLRLGLEAVLRNKGELPGARA